MAPKSPIRSTNIPWGIRVILAWFGFTIVTLESNRAPFSSVSREEKIWFPHLYLSIPAQTVMINKVITAFTISLLSLAIISIGELIGIKISPIIRVN